MCDGEVSADGHNWSMGAYATDYLEKTGPQVMVAVVAVMMGKANVQLQIIKMVLSGIIVNGPA